MTVVFPQSTREQEITHMIDKVVSLYLFFLVAVSYYYRIIVILYSLTLKVMFFLLNIPLEAK